MANFFRLLLGGLIALGAIIVTLLVGLLVAIGTIFGLLASRFRPGGNPAPRSRSSRHQSSVGGAGEIIDVEVTDVTDVPPNPAPRP